MAKIELGDFYNDGFGWICKHCEREIADSARNSDAQRSRLMSEGEAENRIPRFSNPALAKWADKAQRTLICPRCGITEPADKF